MVSLVAAVLAAAVAAPPAPPAASNLYRILWTKQLTPATLLEYHPQEPGGAGVDPASGLVVVGTRDGWVHALLPDGNRLWEFRTAGSFQAAPLVGSDAVFVGSLDGRIYAREKSTGAERWTYDVKE